MTTSPEALPSRLASLATRFDSHIAAARDMRLLAPPSTPRLPGIVWTNTLYAGAGIRRAHIEFFSVPGRFAVLHLCIFPSLNSACAIFGFDIVAGPDIATGLFLDCSSVTEGPPAPGLATLAPESAATPWAERRAPPAWGGIFSNQALFIRPRGQELAAGLAIAETALCRYLAAAAAAPANPDPVFAAAGQIRYSLAQRENPHTRRMLARFAGAATADNFIDTILFPLPETLREAA